MQVLKQLLNFYINSSIHVALAAYALMRVTEKYTDLPYNEALDYFVFFSTITAYNYIKYAGIAKWHHRSLTDSLRRIQVFSVFCFAATLYYASLLSEKLFYCLIPFVVVTLAYETPFLRKKKINLRNVVAVKIIVLVVVWSGVTVLLPLVDKGLEFSGTSMLLFFQRAFFLMALTIPFDIRDIKFDDDSLKTIPQLFGVNNAKKLSFVLLLASLVIEFVVSPTQEIKYVFLFIVFLSILMVMRASAKQSKYYSSFWLEGIPILWWLLLYYP